MALWGRWKDILDKFKFEHPMASSQGENLPASKREAIQAATEQIQRCVDEHYSPKNSGRSAGPQQLRQAISNLEGMLYIAEERIKRAESKAEKLLDYRKQEDWADRREKLRLFAFRMATGVGLGFVLLGTYWLAGRWGIQMPLRF